MVWISPLGMPVSQFAYEQKPKNYDKYDCWEMNLNLSKSEIIENFIGYHPQEGDSWTTSVHDYDHCIQLYM